jgi:ABC-type transporter Mla MlaB component
MKGLAGRDLNMMVDPIEMTIMLTGPVTVYEVGTIRETLRAALAEGKAVRIDLTDSGPWDVAGLQLLISCVKSGRERGQAVQLVSTPRGCAELAERSGLADWLRSVEG